MTPITCCASFAVLVGDTPEQDAELEDAEPVSSDLLITEMPAPPSYTVDEQAVTFPVVIQATSPDPHDACIHTKPCYATTPAPAWM